MSDVWYRVEGATTQGPMTLAEFTAILSAVPERNAVLVWRPGLANWERAENVREVADALFGRPRLEAGTPAGFGGPEPGSPAYYPHQMQQDLAARPGTVGEPPLRGIGGWLILVAIGQVLAPLRLLVSAAGYYGSLDRSMFEEFPVTFIGEALFNVTVAALVISTTVLFFRTSRLFPKFFICELAAMPLVVPLSAVWAATTISAKTGQPAGELMQAAFDPSDAGAMTAAVIGAAIWIPYALKSRRVANTFVN